MQRRCGRRSVLQATLRRCIAGAGHLHRLLLVLLLALVGCSGKPSPAPKHEAYIWQRQWTPAVAAAVHAQAPQFGGWRVLALQVVGTSVTEVLPDLGALKATRLPVRAVVRIEGARAPLPVATLRTRLGPLLQRWRAAGVALAGIEVDHDCATAALAGYAQWLRELRSVLPGDLALSITALPTWLESPALADVLAAVDASVLQVHAVDAPRNGLIDPMRAHAWIRAWDRLGKRFHVALPAYGVRVYSDAAGTLTAVDAEAAARREGAAGVELRADPVLVAQVLKQVAATAPAHLAGYLWFRLPVAGDQRGWSATTLAAVLGGSRLQARFAVVARADASGGHDLLLHHRGNLDATPPTVELPAQCRLGDASGRYRLQLTDDGRLRLAPGDDAWLRAGSRMRIGWARCERGLEPEWSVR